MAKEQTPKAEEKNPHNAEATTRNPVTGVLETVPSDVVQSAGTFTENEHHE